MTLLSRGRRCHVVITTHTALAQRQIAAGGATLLSGPKWALLTRKSRPEVPRCYQNPQSPSSGGSRGRRCHVVITTDMGLAQGQVAARGASLLSGPTIAQLRGKSRPQVPRCYHDRHGPCSHASRCQRCLVVITTHTALAPREVTARVITTHAALAQRQVAARGASLLSQPTQPLLLGKSRPELSRLTQPLLRGKSRPEVPRCYHNPHSPCS